MQAVVSAPLRALAELGVLSSPTAVYVVPDRQSAPTTTVTPSTSVDFGRRRC